jgi:D-aminoacyl-tRNA deacylase
MVTLYVCSLEDVASVNIKRELLELGEWTPGQEFEGAPLLYHGGTVMATIPGIHLYADDIDEKVSRACGAAVSEVVFLSRHRAASGQRSLTVHPIGNWGKAEYGGRERTLVQANPDLMTSLLRELKVQAQGLEFEVTFEVTHHGPYLRSPTLFIEIGSSEATWGDRDAAKAIARSLLEVKILDCPKAVGLGGGHYAPRFTEVSLAKKISFGHMLPNYAIDLSDQNDLAAKVKQALEKSGAKLVYLHKKSMKRSEATMVAKLVADLGYEVVDSSDLEDI